MDVLHDIHEVESCLEREVESVNSLLPVLRALAWARRNNGPAELQRLLSQANAAPRQENNWQTVASSASLQEQVVAWHATCGSHCSNEVKAALHHVLPQLYDKFVNASCQPTPATKLPDAAVDDLRGQIVQLQADLKAAREDAAADRTVDETVLAQLEAAEAENKRLAGVNRSLQRRHELQASEQRQLAEQLDRQIEELRAAAVQQEARNADLEAECNALCNDVDELQRAKAQLSAQKEALLQEVSDLRHADGLASQALPQASAQCSPIRVKREAGAAQDQRAHHRSSTEAQGAEHASSPHAAAALPLQPASPAKRAAAPRSLTGSVQGSPLKKRAHSFGIGEPVAQPPPPSSHPPAAVPRSLWDTARGRSQHTPRAGADAALADVPLSQQPRCSRGKLRTCSVSPVGRTGTWPRSHSPPQWKPPCAEQGVQTDSCVTADASHQCDLSQHAGAKSLLLLVL